MKTRFLTVFGLVGLSISFVPLSFGDNDFCNLIEDLENQEELIQDNIVLIEFLKVLPSAELTRATAVAEPDPPQISMSWSTGVYSFDIQIDGYDVDNPSDCFFPVGYRLNAPHLPEMIGTDYHKDPQIVLNQIDELEPKYVKGGPAPEEEPEPFPGEQYFDEDIKKYCEYAVERGLPTPWKYRCYDEPMANPQRGMDFSNSMISKEMRNYNYSDNAPVCFENSYDSCISAKVEQTRTTPEGDPIHVGAYITDDCKIHVIEDNREDKWSSLDDRKITERECSNMQIKDNQMVLSSCDIFYEFVFYNNSEFSQSVTLISTEPVPNCGSDSELVDGICTLRCGAETVYENGVCLVIKFNEPTHMEPSIFLDGFMFLIMISPFFIPGSAIFIVLSKTPRYDIRTRIAVCIAAILVLLYFLWALTVGVYPPVYA